MLQDRMPDKKIEILKGTMGKKERESVMQRVKDKQVDILLATQLAREGLDIVHLDRLFLATPKKAAAAVQQEVGRIMRPATGKSDAIVYDFWDSKTGILQAQFWKRRAVYKQIGMNLQTRQKQHAK
jgi:superfamily II DNA or RNA helicase